MQSQFLSLSRVVQAGNIEAWLVSQERPSWVATTQTDPNPRMKNNSAFLLCATTQIPLLSIGLEMPAVTWLDQPWLKAKPVSTF